jgi:iron complex outermembrane receptor protein
MTYANIATGFRSGGFNPYNSAQRPAIRPFDPEKAITYEAGARMQFLDRRVTINPTVFHTSWEKIQVQSLVPDDAGLLTRVLFNAGKARSYGAELEWAAKLTRSLRIFGSFAYLDIKYTDVGQAEGITLNSPLQRAPKWTFAAGGSYTHDLASGAKVTTTLNYNFQDEQRSIPSDSDGMLLPSYDLLNGRIEYRDPTDHWRVGAYVSNLLDEKYFLGGIRYTSVAGPRWNVGPPREVGVSLSYNF